MTHVPEMPADCPQPGDINDVLQEEHPFVQMLVGELEAARHGPSFYLTLPCRTFAQAVRDVSKHRDLDDWVWEELRLRRHTAEVISLAQARAELAVRRRR